MLYYSHNRLQIIVVHLRTLLFVKNWLKFWRCAWFYSVCIAQQQRISSFREKK
jgi:hypothetical protein